MKLSFCRLTAACAALLMVTSQSARANPEMAVDYDARSMGMGATGVAASHGITGAFHNPSAINSTDTLDVSLTLSPYVSQSSATARTAGQTLAKFDSQAEFGPLGFFGAAVRLHDRVTVGVAALMLGTSGARYANVPLSITGQPTLGKIPSLGSFNGYIATYELRVPVAVKVTPWLDVGVAWRPTFSNFYGSVKIRDTEIAHESLYGQWLGGVQAGVMIKPHKQVRVGLNYRSRSDVQLKGTETLNLASVGGPVASIPASTTVSVPHHFGAGVLVSFLKERLNVTGDFKYFMTHDSAKANGHAQIDALSGHVGAEYYIFDVWPVRAGYFIARSSTAPRAASAVVAPPGLVNSGSVGTGLHFRYVDVDAMVGYGQGGSRIAEANPPGVYRAHTINISASATVHL